MATHLRQVKKIYLQNYYSNLTYSYYNTTGQDFTKKLKSHRTLNKAGLKIGSTLGKDI